MTCACPHCGGKIAVTLTAIAAARLEPAVREIDMIEPCQIAGRLDLSEAYVRRLIKRGIAQGLAGFEKRGGRLYAAPDAVKDLWNG